MNFKSIFQCFKRLKAFKTAISSYRNLNFIGQKATCLRNRTTLRFDFHHSFMVCAQTSVFDTQNPEISGFSTAHAYKYKTKRQAKMKRDSRKMTFLLISHQATLALKMHRFRVKRKMKKKWKMKKWRKSKRSVVLLRREKKNVRDTCAVGPIYKSLTKISSLARCKIESV